MQDEAGEDGHYSQETGQALYSVVQDEVREDENQYSLLQYGTNRVRGGTQPHQESSAIPREEEEEDMGEYSTISQPAAHPSQPHRQVDKKKSKRADTNLHASEADTAMDQLYAQVDKKKSKKKDAVATAPHASEADPAVDQT